MPVPFADLRRQTAALRAQLDEAASRVLDRGWYVLGEEGAAFEEAFASWLGTRSCVGVASGTDAVELALRALGVGPGDEVLTQANTCVPTVAGVERTGARAVLCDADPATGAIDPASAAEAVGERTRAIVVVHLYGHMGDVRTVQSLGLPVVEDCAQAHGAHGEHGAAGTYGSLGAFSFYPTKNLGALGDGGAVVTEDPELAQRLRLLRHYGQTGRYEHAIAGVNSRLDELQAAFLRVKLEHLDAGIERRRAIAAVYDEALRDCEAVRPLAVRPGTTHARHLYVVRCRDRATVQQALETAGVGTLVHYPRAVHQHPPYADRRRPGISLTGSEQLGDEVLSLPLFPELTNNEVDHVAAALSRL
jgi:dTDP-4-amino-4,6-dideoxygalactose transaminase